METSTIDLDELRTKMTALGVSQSGLARAAAMPPSAVSAALNGHGYLGAKRWGRLQDALHKMALEVAARTAADQAAQSQTSAEAQPPANKATPRARRL